MSKRPMATAAVVGLAVALAAGQAAEPASAADLGRPREPVYAPPPPLEPHADFARWTGFYLGGTLGYGWEEGETGGFVSIPYEQSGLLGTIHAGFNWQLGQVVLGVEADVGTGDFGTSDDVGLGAVSSSLNVMGSLRARAGFLLSPALLLYGTAGLAWADMDYQLIGDVPRSETFSGYQVGVGGELMMTDHVSLRLEYLYTDLGGEPIGVDGTFEPDFNTVRAGISFKF